MLDPASGSRLPAPAMPVGVRAALALTASVIAVLGGLAAASYWGAGSPSTFTILPIAEPYAVRAEALITKPQPTETDLAAAEQATRRELSIAPRRVDGHLRLAIIDALRDGGLTTPALAELKRSYEFSPLDPDYFGPRIRFALEHWGELDAETRTCVSTEIAVTSKFRPSAGVREIVESIINPQGRLGGLMSLSFDPERSVVSTSPNEETPSSRAGESRNR